MGYIIAGALLGGIGGGLGGLLGVLFEKWLSRNDAPTEAPSRTIPTICMLLGLFAVNNTVWRTKLARKISPPSRMQIMAEELIALPALKGKIEAKSFEEAQSIGFQLASSGRLRLTDDALVQRAQLISQYINKASDQDCGQFASGNLPGETFMKSLEKMPLGVQRSWFQFMRAALEAELEKKPLWKRPAHEEIRSALDALKSPLSPDEQKRFDRTFNGIKSASPDDACWMARQLYTFASETSEPYQTVLARLLALP